MRRLSLLVSLIVALAAAPARAADAIEDAKRHFQRAQTHFAAGEFRQAAEAYKETFRVHPDPTLLFNVALCYRKVGDRNEALSNYRLYLQRAPAAPNRAEVEAAIAELERQPGPQPPAGPQPAPPAPGYGAPAPGVPSPGYAPAPPAQGAPPSGYGASPPPPYGAPPPAYGAPPPAYGTPAPGGYGAPPPPAYGAPAYGGYGAPPPPAYGGTSSPPYGSAPPPPVYSPETPPPPPAGVIAGPETAPAPAPPTEDRPLYTRWWFWGIVGAVAIGTAVAVVGAAGDPATRQPYCGSFKPGGSCTVGIK